MDLFSYLSQWTIFRASNNYAVPVPYYVYHIMLYIQILVLRLNEHVSLTVRVVLALLPHLQRSRLARSENTVDHVPHFWHSVHSVLLGLRVLGQNGKPWIWRGS